MAFSVLGSDKIQVITWKLLQNMIEAINSQALRLELHNQDGERKVRLYEQVGIVSVELAWKGSTRKIQMYRISSLHLDWPTINILQHLLSLHKHIIITNIFMKHFRIHYRHNIHS